MMNRFFHRMMGNEASKQVSQPISSDFGVLENRLQDPCATPTRLTLDFLRAITRDFSQEQEIGRGGFGVVYKGILQNGKTIAVKKLVDIHNLDDAQFRNEVIRLIGLKHKNIVQLVGYCADSQLEATQVREEYVMAEIRKRLLCFEYLNNKSLDKHISDESCGLEWNIRYEIIRGICCGLHYLHEECRIVHLDLKPENILLDESMVPKIADFGMSRIFGQEQSRMITKSRGGTFGYMAPEYLMNGLITTKSDIFSLGIIIIELMTGSREYPHCEADFGRFIENVIGNWRNRLEKETWCLPLEISRQQVNTCIMIGLNCVDPDPKKRPAAGDVLQMLNGIENMMVMHILESEVGTFSISCTANTSISWMDFNTTLNSASTTGIINVSRVLSSSGKGNKISILAFEVANTIAMGSSLMKILSKQSMKHLKEGLLNSDGVSRLISKDRSQLHVLVEADIREDLRRFSTKVARFGDRCVDPTWHHLDRYFSRKHFEPRRVKTMKETLVSSFQYLLKLAARTSELYGELLLLDKYLCAFQYKQQFECGGSEHDKMLRSILSSMKQQRNVVLNLKKKSLWCKTMEDILDKLEDMIVFMHMEVDSAFLKNYADQSVSPASNLHQTLGSTGLALHYANVILQINTLALTPPAVLPDRATRDALYQALPRCIKTKIRQFCLSREKTTTVPQVKVEMYRILQWLVPVAELTRLYYKNGAFGEWANRGVEPEDIEQEKPQVMGGVMHGRVVNKIETLYYADKERIDGYILDLVRGLHCVVTYSLRP